MKTTTQTYMITLYFITVHQANCEDQIYCLSIELLSLDWCRWTTTSVNYVRPHRFQETDATWKRNGNNCTSGYQNRTKGWTSMKNENTLNQLSIELKPKWKLLKTVKTSNFHPSNHVPDIRALFELYYAILDLCEFIALDLHKHHVSWR